MYVLVALMLNFSLPTTAFVSLRGPISPSRILMTEGSTDEDMVTVRFVNTPSGKDVVAKVPSGSNLLRVGDVHGVELPRACRTGLCGSCTCELKDPQAIATPTNKVAGFATIRACSTSCFVPPGESEMVVDVYRLSGRKTSPLGVTVEDSSSGATEMAMKQSPNALSRFQGDWEKDFRPTWESDASMGSNRRTCVKCSGSGRLPCYNCGGKGVRSTMEGGNVQCEVCMGSTTVSCATCGGVGSILKVKKSLRARNFDSASNIKKL
jgi:ferredoxin